MATYHVCVPAPDVWIAVEAADEDEASERAMAIADSIVLSARVAGEGWDLARLAMHVGTTPSELAECVGFCEGGGANHGPLDFGEYSVNEVD